MSKSCNIALNVKSKDCSNEALLKVLDQIQKNHPPLCPMKNKILVSEESPYFSDYCSEILGPKYISFRCYEQ